MTDALMPHGLSCLSKLLNKPQPSELTKVTSKAIPRRFYRIKTPLDEIMPSSMGTYYDEENGGKLPQLQIVRNHSRAANRLDNVNQFEDDEDELGYVDGTKLNFSSKADMVKCDYTGALEECAGIWQEVASSWDRVQIRFNQCRPYEVERRNAKPQCSIERPIEKENAPEIHYKPIIDPVTKKEVQFSRKVPGYCGYVPRYPIPPKPQETCKNPGFKSISKATYKIFPSNEYKIHEFAHKGPLSSQVTTTPPFNPYNKLDLITLNGQKILWKRPLLQDITRKKRTGRK